MKTPLRLLIALVLPLSLYGALTFSINAPSGLRLRAAPSRNAAVIALLTNRTFAELAREPAADTPAEVIEGKPGIWVQISCTLPDSMGQPGPHTNGWVFSAFLSQDQQSDPSTPVPVTNLQPANPGKGGLEIRFQDDNQCLLRGRDGRQITVKYENIFSRTWLIRLSRVQRERTPRPLGSSGMWLLRADWNDNFFCWFSLKLESPETGQAIWFHYPHDPTQTTAGMVVDVHHDLKAMASGGSGKPANLPQGGILRSRPNPAAPALTWWGADGRAQLRIPPGTKVTLWARTREKTTPDGDWFFVEVWHPHPGRPKLFGWVKADLLPRQG